jgi:hypothetical protein
MPHSLSRLVALCATTLPLPAAAACLTAKDLDRGVVFLFENEDTTVVRALGAGMVEVTENYASDQSGIRFESYIGPYILKEEQLDLNGVPRPDTWSVTVYDAELSDLPIPAADTPSWTGNGNYQEFGASPIGKSIKFEYKAGDPVTLSGCTYDVVLVAGTFERGEPDPWSYQQFSYYFPALGTSVIVAWNNPRDGFQQAMPITLDRLP